MSKDIFGKLLQDAKDLPSATKTSDTPQLDRGIDQIAKELENLNFKYQSQDFKVMGKRFLADSGIDAIEMNSNLKDLKTRFTFEKKEIIKSTNVEAYLNKKQETYVAETIEESRRNTNAAFLENMNDLLHSNWQKSKAKILEEWELEQDNKVFGRKTKNMDIFKNQVPRYAAVIKDLNSNRLLNENVNLVDKLKQLSNLTQCTTTQKKSMQDSWDIISHLTKNIELKSYSLARGSIDSIKPVKKNRIFIQSSKSWLEKQYLSIVERFLFENAVKAQVGGSPSLMHRLHNYVLLRYKDISSSTWIDRSLEIKDNTPIWLFLYILLRCGQYTLALKYVQENEQNFHLAPEFPSCFKEYIESPSRRLSEASRLRIFDRYKTIEYVTNEDPYKVLIYKMIGRCHLHVPCNPEIVNTIEDYIWYHLNLVSEPIYDEEREFERYRLEDLQKRIIASDPSAFDKNGLNPWFYFNILLLTSQFERAIDYLYKHEIFRLEAVHFGITFAYHGLIRIPEDIYDNTIDLLVLDMDGRADLNYCRLLNQYIQSFLNYNTLDALEYICLYTLYPTEQMEAFCYEKISNFIVSYPNYKQVIGERNILDGPLAKYSSIIGIKDNNEFKEKIIYPVAEKFKYGERYQDSVYIYEASNDYVQVFKVLNYQLAYVLNKNMLDETNMKALNQQLVDYCSAVMKHLKDKFYVERDEALLKSHYTLLYFLQAIIEYDNKQYEQVLKLIKATNLMPLLTKHDVIFQLVEQYNQLEDETVRNLIPNMIVITVESVYQLYKFCSNQKHAFNDSYKSTMKECEQSMVSILTFVGMIAPTIPSEVVQKINKRASEMHC